MDNYKLADLLLPHTDKGPDFYEGLYPARNLPEGAMVTRLGPSPTGFIHLGNLYGAFVDERLAKKTGGVFYLRIEDTDEKREVEGAVEMIISALKHFDIDFDEGAGLDGELGDYGPYYQRQREAIYKTFVKKLLLEGRAYPCFCTEDEISALREKQEKAGETPGYYGKYAVCRNLTLEEIKNKIQAGLPFVIRFKSFGDPEKNFEIEDGIRGKLSMPENFQDMVILKQNGIPTYHFAHVVDDHLMRTSHVVRGEEWLSSLPIHVALFQALGWQLPIYCHTGSLMKLDGSGKRKLSKRKDPELSLDYYQNLGYHPKAVREYLMTIINSNYEEWRMANPLASMDEFDFTLEKMSSSGTLFDLDKLNDVSKETLATISDEDIYEFMLAWAEKYRPELLPVLTGDKTSMLRILAMDRHNEKPRKDLVYCQQIFEYISYFFDDYFKIEDELPVEVSREDARLILEAYLKTYDYADEQPQWFDKIREIAEGLGFAAKPKDYKKNPDLYKGHVGHVSTVIRLALTGRASAPDLWEIQQILGEAKVRERILANISSF